MAPSWMPPEAIASRASHKPSLTIANPNKSERCTRSLADGSVVGAARGRRVAPQEWQHASRRKQAHASLEVYCLTVMAHYLPTGSFQPVACAAVGTDK